MSLNRAKLPKSKTAKVNVPLHLIKLTYHLVSLSVKMYYFALRCISVKIIGMV